MGTITIILFLLVIICVAQPYFSLLNARQKKNEGQREKIKYALENNFKFYLDGEDVTDKIEHMDISLYSVSFEKYDQCEILLAR